MSESPNHTFVFADLAGYTLLTEAHGDQRSSTVAGEFFALTRSALGTARLVKTLGDGVMVVAPSAEEGVRVAGAIVAAVASQRDFPAVRIGVHEGPAVEREGDYFGRAVNVTARIMEAAKPGQTLCTEGVAQAARDAALARPVALGPVRFKHVVEPVALFALQFGTGANAMEYFDPVCRMRVGAEDTRTLNYQGVTFHFCSVECADQFVEAPERYTFELESLTGTRDGSIPPRPAP